MPTNVNPDDPFATTAARTQAAVGGPRDPGTPSIAGKPGVQAGRTTAPAPPAPATAPVGRPPTPAPAPVGSRAAMGGGKPTQPGTAAPAAVPPTAAPATPAAATPPTPGSPQPAAAAGSSVTTGVGAPAAPAAPAVDAAGNPVAAMPTAPTVPPPGTLLPGAQVQTPLGVASTSPDGSQSLALDANGAQKYKETMAALRNKFTVPKVMKGMQGLPAMELKLGSHNFDPFSGRFHGRD